MEWLAILELVLAFLAECRQNRARAEVKDSLKKLGPFEKLALKVKLRRDGKTREEQADVMQFIEDCGTDLSDEDCEQILDCAEDCCRQMGIPLFEEQA